MLISGILTAKNILIVFVLIGMMTALWHACGTIPFIICHAAKLLRPEVILLVSFLLNCALSVLTGTSFGTAATIGVICMAMGVSAGASPLLLGGAILSGAFFGDRCSPFSTSALLVSELTKTSIFDNIKNMVRTAWFPFLLTCILYGVLGFQLHSQTETTDLTSLFGREVVLHPTAILPAVVILILALMRIPVKFAMLASIAASLVVGFFIQDLAVTDLPQLLLSGYHAADPEAATFLDGGGILSMVKVAAIVCISSSYAGIFQNTRLLDGLKAGLSKLGARITPFGAILVAAAGTSMIACNQTLSIMLTTQLGHDLEPDNACMALALENSAVIVAPLIPWSIAGAVPLATIGAPMTSLFAAFFLYLVPLCYLFSAANKAGHVRHLNRLF
ncbi:MULTISPECIES: Na+/H+ antiporter NhaC family protein [unclassified Clostridium]|uniref:Na+/H+ antiporter NhaC family protein n=1 Tax=unclassified Clostridium TaxID=2614128 RepID=UPI000E4AAA0D|nr:MULTISPECIES: Na+/H+ antiporter NhaC family protein [unclassified Clostridium]RHS82746.1 sodium:proton antiporter [Clostridium sp. AM42-4]RHV84793.1 sodium:proton antiporter [Clostridium sp. OF09-36]